MTATDGNGTPGRTTVGLASLLNMLPKESADGVIKKALSNQSEVSGETQAAFRKAVGAHITVHGFRNSEMAPAPLLQEPVSQCARRNDDLAGAVLKVWAESQRPLRQQVDSCLRQRGLLNDEPDYSEHNILVVHPDPKWDEAIDILTVQCPDASRDDLHLMSAYASGRFAHEVEEVQSPSPASAELSRAFQRLFDLLGTLPPDAPEWEEGVQAFVNAIGK